MAASSEEGLWRESFGSLRFLSCAPSEAAPFVIKGCEASRVLPPALTSERVRLARQLQLAGGVEPTNRTREGRGRCGTVKRCPLEGPDG